MVCCCANSCRLWSYLKMANHFIYHLPYGGYQVAQSKNGTKNTRKCRYSKTTFGTSNFSPTCRNPQYFTETSENYFPMNLRANQNIQADFFMNYFTANCFSLSQIDIWPTILVLILNWIVCMIKENRTLNFGKNVDKS